MLAGHIGAGLAIGRLERRVNVGMFIAAALLLDFALWPFILLGWEYANAGLHRPRHDRGAPPPPSGTAMAGASLLTLVVVCALAYRFGSLRPPGRWD